MLIIILPVVEMASFKFKYHVRTTFILFLHLKIIEKPVLGILLYVVLLIKYIMKATKQMFQVDL